MLWYHDIAWRQCYEPLVAAMATKMPCPINSECHDLLRPLLKMSNPLNFGGNVPSSKLHSSLMGAEVQQGRECMQAGYKVNAALYRAGHSRRWSGTDRGFDLSVKRRGNLKVQSPTRLSSIAQQLLWFREYSQDV